MVYICAIYKRYDFFYLSEHGLMTFAIMAVVFSFFHYFMHHKMYEPSNAFRLVLNVFITGVLAISPMVVWYLSVKLASVTMGRLDMFYVERTYFFARSICLGFAIEGIYQIISFLLLKLKRDDEWKLN